MYSNALETRGRFSLVMIALAAALAIVLSPSLRRCASRAPAER